MSLETVEEGNYGVLMGWEEIREDKEKHERTKLDVNMRMVTFNEVGKHWKLIIEYRWRLEEERKRNIAKCGSGRALFYNAKEK